MPLQNRVSPFGDIVSVSARGTCMGNRGIIHDAKTKTLLTRRWQHQAWICCVLSFKGYQHPIMGPSAYTELFFLDEATALAAGHRPCAYCRRADFNAFKEAWIKAKQLGGDRFVNAPEIDRTLHRERVTRKREKVTYVARVDDLPDGVMVVQSGRVLLISGDNVLPWTPYGYQERLPRPSDVRFSVLTPRSTVRVIAAGYVPMVHASAQSRPSHASRLSFKLEEIAKSQFPGQAVGKLCFSGTGLTRKQQRLPQMQRNVCRVYQALVG